MSAPRAAAACLTLAFATIAAAPGASAETARAEPPVLPAPPVQAATEGPDGAGPTTLSSNDRPTPGSPQAELDALRRQLDEQRRQIEALRRALDAQQAQVGALRRELSAAALLSSSALETQRGAGVPAREPGTAAAGQARELIAQATGQPQPPVASPGQQQQPVGQAPDRPATTPQVAPIFDQPGVLTPRGKLVVEPSLQYSYSSSNRLSVIGYTVIPAINIGLFDVREVKRTSWIGTLAARYGITNRLEVEARVPYVYRDDDTISRPFGLGAGQDSLFNASGKGIGDIEFAGRYQLNQGGPNKFYYIGTLRFKSRTGRDPFEVLSDPGLPSGPGLAAGTSGLQRELPTGSGFYGIQPGLTWLFPSDPAVFFGSFSYLHSFARSNVMRNTTNGPEMLGEIRPGGIFGFNVGMGLSLNDKASLSIGYDHASIGKTRQNGQASPLAVRTQLGTLLVGLSYRLDAQRSLNWSLGVGVTRDAPDLTLSLRVPYSL